jgi:hypothetical protein
MNTPRIAFINLCRRFLNGEDIVGLFRGDAGEFKRELENPWDYVTYFSRYQPKEYELIKGIFQDFGLDLEEELKPFRGWDFTLVGFLVKQHDYIDDPDALPCHDRTFWLQYYLKDKRNRARWELPVSLYEEIPDFLP